MPTKAKSKSKTKKRKKTLVIVESPAKAKTIEKYLGRNYHVIASKGHIRDLPKSQWELTLRIITSPSIFLFAARVTQLKSLRVKLKKLRKYIWHLTPIVKGSYCLAHCSCS